MKNNQKGFSTVITLSLGLLVVGLIGITAFRVGNNLSSQNQEQLAEDLSDIPAAIKVEKEEPSKTVKVPEKEKPAEQVSDAPKKENTPIEEKKDKVYLSIKLVSSKQDGAIVSVHSQIEKAVTGTCNFKLYREGYERVHSSKKISNSSECKGTLDISDMPNYKGWSLHVWFDGDDGKTYAYQEAKPMTLTDPN